MSVRQRKTEQLQLRVTRAEKARIAAAARAAGLDMSEFVLARVAPAGQDAFARLCDGCRGPGNVHVSLAHLNDFLTRLAGGELREAVAAAPPPMGAFLDNYVAAMVETAGAARAVAAPAWTANVVPLQDPWFGSSLVSLRLHLLVSSPPAFRRRNLFVDTTLGGRA